MKYERGSAMIWIFVGIMLFAALGVAMMQGTRTSGNMITGEQARTEASRLINAGNELKMAVQRMKMRGCEDTKIGFDNSVWKTVGGTLTAPTNHNPTTDSCRVFNVAGGGLTPFTLQPNSMALPSTYVTSGHSVAHTASVIGVGTAAPDLVLITYYVPKAVCIEVNKKLGISSSDALLNDDFSGIQGYNGAYNPGGVIGDQAAAFVGRGQGCLQYTSGDDNDLHFYQVLIAR